MTDPKYEPEVQSALEALRKGEQQQQDRETAQKREQETHDQQAAWARKSFDEIVGFLEKFTAQLTQAGEQIQLKKSTDSATLLLSGKTSSVNFDKAMRGGRGLLPGIQVIAQMVGEIRFFHKQDGPNGGWSRNLPSEDTQAKPISSRDVARFVLEGVTDPAAFRARQQ